MDPPAGASAPPVLARVRGSHHREGWVRMLPFVGIGIGVVALAYLGALWWSDANQAAANAGAIPVLFTAGKEAAIPTAISLWGADPWLVATTMILTDVAATFLLYPVVHLTLDSFEEKGGFLNRKLPFGGKMVRSAVRRAEKHRRLVERYGVAGLFLYSIIPFFFNGPPIVAALGRLTGLRAIHIVPVLVAAIVTTSLAWAIFYNALFKALEGFPKWIPITLSLSVMALTLGLAALGAIQEKGEEAPPTA